MSVHDGHAQVDEGNRRREIPQRIESFIGVAHSAAPANLQEGRHGRAVARALLVNAHRYIQAFRTVRTCRQDAHLHDVVNTVSTAV